MTRRRLLSLLLIVTFALAVRAELKVSLLICEPGRNVYELEGHAALRFVDTEADTDVTINWGVFDFNSHGFIYRFVKGETDYMVGACPTDTFLALYNSEGRRVTEQPLNLTAEQAEELLRLVKVNLQPENVKYRYKYLTDNCSTRPLTLIEKATGTISLPSAADRNVTSTWRNEMRRYHANYPWYQFGIDLALGSGLDVEIGQHERSFAPLFLRDYIAGSALNDTTIILLAGHPEGAPEGPTAPLATPWAVAIYVTLLTIAAVALKNRIPLLYRSYTSIFFLLMAAAGTVITFLVFISEHEATTPNWLLLWLNPFAVIAAVGIWLKKLNRVVFYYQIVNFALLIVLLLIFALGIQSPNGAFLPWILSDMMLAASYILTNRWLINRHLS